VVTETEQTVEHASAPDASATATAPAPAAADIGSKPENALWYVIHTYSGYENKVKTNLEHRIASMDMAHKIFRVVVPTEEEVEIKNGQRRTVHKKIYPGYVLVEMVLEDDSWYVVRNTPGVTSFVGHGNTPTPLPESEVQAILKQMREEKPQVRITYLKGDRV
jgi:transcriptional antiterminator NusG